MLPNPLLSSPILSSPILSSPLLSTKYNSENKFEIGVDEAGRGPLFGRLNIIKDWLSETPTKLEDIKNWALNHKYLKGLLFIISSPLNEITYETKKQNNIDNETDFILWLNSFDNKLHSLTNEYIWFDWKLDNVINWLKSNGLFNRCLICNCIYSYSKGKPCCTNKYYFK